MFGSLKNSYYFLNIVTKITIPVRVNANPHFHNSGSI